MAIVKCPRCGRDFVRRISTASLPEKLLRAFYVYPFKCQLCSERFRALQWGMRDALLREDRREYSRMEREFPITFSGEGIAGDGTLLNISMGGCSFVSSVDLPVGLMMRLGLLIAADTPPVTVDAAVVRHTGKRAAGVEFVRWQERERERLELFVRGMLIGSQQ
jgi:c-di-GMP-binding flagellar brake protein YcgR